MSNCEEVKYSEKERELLKQSIMQMLELANDRKLGCIYRFVLHIIK